MPWGIGLLVRETALPLASSDVGERGLEWHGFQVKSPWKNHDPEMPA
jgi:hypothetical protein